MIEIQLGALIGILLVALFFGVVMGVVIHILFAFHQENKESKEERINDIEKTILDLKFRQIIMEKKIGVKKHRKDR